MWASGRRHAFIATFPFRGFTCGPGLPGAYTATVNRFLVRKSHHTAPVTCIPGKTETENSRLMTHVTIAARTTGGRGPLSAEFLTVVGAIATIVAVITVIPIAMGYISLGILQSSLSRKICTFVSSFSYGLLLSSFDLKKAQSLRLTIAFSLLMRFVCMPILSHTVAIAGYTIVKLSGTRAAAATAAAVATAPETVKATMASLSLPAGVLSSLLLLSTTPTGISPCAAMLSLHVHTTLLAILTALNMTCFPIVPRISHALNVWAHRSSFLNVGDILPEIAAPPSFLQLLLLTSLPFLSGIGLARVLPRRLAALCSFLSLPVSWLCSLLLLIAAIGDVVGGNATGLAGSVGLCGGVTIMMLLLARALGYGLRLDARAKRTLTLYFCTQGTVVGAGIAPSEFAAAPHIAAALVGMLFAAIMGKLWSNVLVKTSTDVIL